MEVAGDAEIGDNHDDFAPINDQTADSKFLPAADPFVTQFQAPQRTSSPQMTSVPGQNILLRKFDGSLKLIFSPCSGSS